MSARGRARVATLSAVERTSRILRGRRRLSSLVCVAVAGALLTGCSAGFGATSTKPYAPGDGINADSGTMRALNVLVVAADGATSGVVVMTLANRGGNDDRLTGIESPEGSVSLSGPTDLPAGGAVQFGNDTDTTATITGLTKLAGEAIELKLTFAAAEPITLRTVVVPATGDYAGITPSATVTASP